MINHENKKDNVVFIHANGFPPASYDSILKNLKNNYKVDNFPYFISGNEETLIKQVEEILINKFKKNGFIEKPRFSVCT